VQGGAVVSIIPRTPFPEGSGVLFRNTVLFHDAVLFRIAEQRHGPPRSAHSLEIDNER
jgi:hypothetical protein